MEGGLDGAWRALELWSEARSLGALLLSAQVVDAALISKWRKPGYEILCSMSAIQCVPFPFVSHVPL